LSGRFDDADDIFKKAKALGSELGYPFASAFPTIFHGELLALTNQYEAAREHIPQGITQIRPDFSSRLFLLGRAYRVMGWLELAAGHHGSAQDWFEQSTEAYHSLADDEAVAWTAAGLGQALYGLGSVEKAQKLVVDALWTAVELQAYISLLFLIPITTLLLDYRKENKWRERLHTLACRDPFLARAPFFNELVWSQLPPLKKVPPVEKENLTGLRRELWTAVSQLLAEDILVQ
jgi:tetratricopeptide (TPR) repeat protein